MDQYADFDTEVDLNAAEILRIATILVDRHGPDAMTVAQVSAHGALQCDRFDEYLVWLDIRTAAARLITCPVPPTPNVSLH